MMFKSYQYKIYSLGGSYVGELDSSKVSGEPRFSSVINGGQGELVVDYKIDPYDFDEGGLIADMNFVKVFCYDSENPSGRLIYSGFISQYVPFVKGADYGVEIHLLGLVSLLSFSYFRDGASYTVTKTGFDPASIIEDIIDDVLVDYPSWFSYSGGFIDSVGTSVDYEFVDRKWIDAIKDTYLLADEGWWWRVEANGQMYFQAKPVTATHRFTLGKDVDEFRMVKSNEEAVNELQYRDGVADTDFSDATSISTYGRRTKIYSNSSTTDATTISQYGDKFIADNKDKKVKGKLIINSTYDIESIKPGDTCQVFNFSSGSESFSLADGSQILQIARVDYSPNKATLTLEKDVSLGNQLESLINKINESS